MYTPSYEHYRCIDHVSVFIIKSIRNTELVMFTIVPVVGMGEKGSTSIVPLGYLNKRHPLFEQLAAFGTSDPMPGDSLGTRRF